jgi:hypothetical protein
MKTAVNYEMSGRKRNKTMTYQTYRITLAVASFVTYYVNGSGASSFEDWNTDFDQSRVFYSRSAAIETLQKLRNPYDKSGEMFVEEYNVNVTPVIYIPPGEIKRRC